MQTKVSGVVRPALATTSGAWVRLIVQGVRSVGVAPQPLLVCAGITEAVLNDPGLRVTQQQVTRLWHEAALVCDNDDLALICGRGFQPLQAPVISYALRSCRTVAEALECLLRFYKLLGEALHLNLSEQEGGLLLRIEPLQPVPDLSIQTALVATAGMVRWLLADEGAPGLSVSLKRTAPARPAAWRDWFGSAPEFAAAEDSLFFPQALLSQPLPGHLPDAARHERIARQALQQLREQNALLHIRYWLEQALQLGEPDRAWVAGCLGISVSTLQRRLRQQGETFRGLLESTRREVALRLLTEGVALNEIGLRLGYQEQSTFQRAFRHWFGMSPGRWRRTVSRTDASASKAG